MLTLPKTRYAKSGDASIAYQVVGDAPVDLVWIGGPAGHLDVEWDNPDAAQALEQLASFTRLVRFDRRGTGLSDPVDRPPSLEQQMDDLRAVMDTVGLERTALFGGSDAGLGALFAATYPERVTALVLWGVAARGADAVTPEKLAFLREALENYGEGRFIQVYAPSRVGDRSFEDWWARYERAAASPGMARKLLELVLQTDVSDILPTIRVPTLVLHRTHDPLIPIELGRDLASRIPNARFVELPGSDPYGWSQDPEPVLDALEPLLRPSPYRSGS
jgi:pimeloyl-ACP methyl ester carboxylesterase